MLLNKRTRAATLVYGDGTKGWVNSSIVIRYLHAPAFVAATGGILQSTVWKF